MLNVKTPYVKIFRRTYNIPFDFSGASAGQWVKIENGEAKLVEAADDLSSANLRIVISRMPKDGNIYEGHDTVPGGTLTVIDDFGAAYVVDGVGALEAVEEGDWLTVSSTAEELGKLKTAEAGDQVVARCTKGSDSDEIKEVQIVSPFVLAETSGS